MCALTPWSAMGLVGRSFSRSSNSSFPLDFSSFFFSHCVEVSSVFLFEGPEDWKGPCCLMFIALSIRGCRTRQVPPGV